MHAAWIALAVAHAVAGGVGQAFDIFWQLAALVMGTMAVVWLPYIGGLALILAVVYGSFGVLGNLTQLGLHLPLSLIALLVAANLPGRTAERTWVLAAVVAALSGALAVVVALPFWALAVAQIAAGDPSFPLGVLTALTSGWELWVLCGLWLVLAVQTRWAGQSAPEARFEDASSAWLGIAAIGTALMALSGGLFSGLLPALLIAVSLSSDAGWAWVAVLFLPWALPVLAQLGVALVCGIAALTDRRRWRIAALIGVAGVLPLTLLFDVVRLAPIAAVALSPCIALAVALPRAVDIR